METSREAPVLIQEEEEEEEERRRRRRREEGNEREDQILSFWGIFYDRKTPPCQIRLL